MHSPRHSQRRTDVRKAFTLVELLVVITIMLIITGLTVAVFSSLAPTDRMRAASRTVQSAFQGAVSRTMFEHRPGGEKRLVGIRLILDPDDPSIVRSLAYIRQPAFEPEGAIRVGRLDMWDNSSPPNNRDFTSDGWADSAEVRVVRGYGTGWKSLFDQGLLVNGSRIRIGRWERTFTVDVSRLRTIPDPNTGYFYQGGAEELILTLPLTEIPATNPFVDDQSGQANTGVDGEFGFAGFDDDKVIQLAAGLPVLGEDDFLEIGAASYDANNGTWRDSDDVTDIHAFPTFRPDSNGRGDYVLELGPALMQAEDPIELPNGVVIDLFYSIVPDEWFEEIPQSNRTVLPWTDLDKDDFNGNGQGIITFGEDKPNKPKHMDILFSAGGPVAGSLAAFPAIHLMLVDAADAAAGLSPEQSQGEKLIITIIPQTGSITTHNVAQLPIGDPRLPRGRYRYAESGQKAGR